MKCPKCGYLGFDTGDRCRNCGYDFSLAGLVPAARSDIDDRVIIRPNADDPGLPLDLTLVDRTDGRAAGNPQLDARPSLDLDRLIGLPAPSSSHPAAPGAVEEFALFPSRPEESDDAPLPRPRTTARPPLAVRRATPEVARVRPRQTPRATQSEAFETPPLTGLGLPSAALGFDASSAYAGPMRRLAAALVDLAALAAINIAVVYFTLRLCGLELDAALTLPWMPLAAFLLLLNGGYFITFAAVGGQTIAQMALGLKVVSDDGGSLPFGRATLRTLAWFFSTVPFGLGLWFALGSDGRTLHDRLTATRVVQA